MTLEERRRLLRTIPTTPAVSTPEVARTPAEDTRSDAEKVLETIAAGGYGAANSVLMGLPEFLIKNVGGSQAMESIRRLRERNQEASTVGDITGTVGSFFIPGGALVKGLGLGAKAVTAGRVGSGLVRAGQDLSGAGKIGKLGTIGSAALRGAGVAGEQAIARGLTNLDFTEGGQNLGQSAMESLTDLPGSIAMGAAFGGGFAKLGEKAGKLLNKYGPELSERYTKGILSRVGVTEKSLKKALFGTEAPELVQDLAGTSGELLKKVAPEIQEAAARTLRSNKAVTELNFKNFIKDLDEAGLVKLVKSANPGVSDEVATLTSKTLQHSAGLQELSLGEGKNVLAGAANLAKNPALAGLLLGGGGGVISDLASGEGLNEGTMQKALIGAALGYGLQRGGPEALGLAAKGLGVLQKATTNPALLTKAATTIEQQQKANQNPAESTAVREQALPPQEVQRARAEFSDKFKGVMNNQLNAIYSQFYSDMPPEEFLQKVAQKTGDFQDMRAMADILYMGDERARDNFLRKYDAYLALKAIDIDKAVNPGFIESTLSIIPGLQAQSVRDRETLVNSLVNLQAEGDPAKRSAAKKQAEAYLKEVEKNPDLLPQFMQDYGLDFADLDELGLTTGV